MRRDSEIMIARGGESEAQRVLGTLCSDLSAAAALKLPPGGSGRASVSAATPTMETLSCRLSPWLAMGCISARHVFHELQAALRGGGEESERSDVDWGYMLQPAELWRREFFSFVVKAMSDGDNERRMALCSI